MLGGAIFQTRNWAFTLTGILVLFASIALPWWTFPSSAFSGGPLTLFGWQFGLIAGLPALASVLAIVAMILPQPERALRFYALLTLVLAVAVIPLSLTALPSVWRANCHVECFGPGPAGPGLGLVLLALGPTIIVCANWRSVRWVDANPP